MKKLISLALIALTSFVFAGCQWFQPAVQEEEATTGPQTATSTATITIEDEETANVTGTITIEPGEAEVMVEEEAVDESLEPVEEPEADMDLPDEEI